MKKTKRKSSPTFKIPFRFPISVPALGTSAIKAYPMMNFLHIHQSGSIFTFVLHELSLPKDVLYILSTRGEQSFTIYIKKSNKREALLKRVFPSPVIPFWTETLSYRKRASPGETIPNFSNTFPSGLQTTGIWAGRSAVKGVCEPTSLLFTYRMMLLSRSTWNHLLSWNLPEVDLFYTRPIVKKRDPMSGKDFKQSSAKIPLTKEKIIKTKKKKQIDVHLPIMS